MLPLLRFFGAYYAYPLGGYPPSEPAPEPATSTPAYDPHASVNVCPPVGEVLSWGGGSAAGWASETGSKYQTPPEGAYYKAPAARPRASPQRTHAPL